MAVYTVSKHNYISERVKKISDLIPYTPNKGSLRTSLENAVLPNFQIQFNGKDIDNNSETYPLLVFRDITYFPLTWRFLVDSFGWTSSLISPTD